MLTLLARRSEVVKQVGDLKNLRHTKTSIMRPGREAAVLKRVIKDYKGHFPKEAIIHIWRLIIAAAISIEEDVHVAVQATETDHETIWCAREYFGSFNPISTYACADTTLHALIEGEATVAILPMQKHDATEQPDWWHQLASMAAAPKVFAQLPFLYHHTAIAIPPCLAVGYVTPEETGDDVSLWVISNDLLNADSASDYEVISKNNSHALIAFDGFVTTFPSKAATDACYIGGFVKPINL